MSFLFDVYQYIGSFTILTNVLVILVIMSKLQLRQKHILLAAIAVGDAINGLHYSYGGFVHSHGLDEVNNTESFFYRFHRQKTKWDCCLLIYPSFDVFGTLFTSLICLLLSVERLMAVKLPMYFRVHYSNSKKTALFVLCVAVTLAWVGVMFLSAYFYEYAPGKTGSTNMCFLGVSSARWFTTSHQSSIIVIQCTAFAISAVAYWGAHKSAQAAQRKSNIRDIRPILVVNALSVALVSIPLFSRLMTYAAKFRPIPNQTQIVQYMKIVPTGNSFINLAVYMIVSKEFRRQALELFSCGKISNQGGSTVAPASQPKGANNNTKSLLGSNRDKNKNRQSTIDPITTF